MRTLLIVVALVSLLLISVTSAEDGHHKHHKKVEKTDADKALSLNHGKKWEIDQTMRTNMDAIYLQSQKKSQDLSKLSSVITASTEQIITNCKMETKADETYHVVLGVLLEVAEELKDKQKSEQALNKLKHAFHVYREYFNHPAP